MIVVSDIDDTLDMFMPIADEIILNISEHRDMILSLLDLLTEVWSPDNINKENTQAGNKNYSFFGKSLKLSLEIAKTTGAKIIIF